METLRIWWTSHYKIPVSSQDWQDLYYEDLLQDFLENLFLKSDERARVARLKHFGFEHSLTGDPLVDRWLEELSRGETPNLNIGEDERSRRRDQLVRQAAEIYKKRTGSSIFKARYYDPLKREWVDPNMYDPNAQYSDDEDPLALDFNDGESSSGVIDEETSKNVSIEAFDEFVNAMGAIRRE